MKKLDTNAGESGQVLVLLALSIVALLAMTALVLDGGRMYLERRRMQNAADAGALAGATILAENGTGAEGIAQQYAMTWNGADSAQVTISSGITITVVACENAQMTFAQMIGLSSATVCARASAAWAYACALEGLRPIAISDTNYLKDVTYYLWDKAPTEGANNMSVRGWIRLDCTLDRGCEYPSEKPCDWMYGGFEHMVSVGEWVLREPGSKSWINCAPVGEVIPIVMFQNTYSPLPGQMYYQVSKFLAFKVMPTDNYDLCPEGKCLQGMFVEDVTPTEPTPNCTAPNSDWKTVYLTE